jgi:glucose/arabinose dehydrogenase
MVGAAVAACGSDDSGTNGETGGTDSGAGGAGDSSASHADGGAPSADSGGGHDATTGDGGSTTTTTGDAATDGGYDTSPVVPKNFPLDTPGIGGYTLTDAFPGAEPLDIPAVITFARTDTANKHPFVLERTGQIRRMADDGTWDYQHPVVDFSAKVNVQGEGGAVGMVLHPSFGDGTGTHDFIYVWYNACQNDTGGPFGCNTYSQKLERYTFHAATNTADTPTLFIEEAEFQNIHNAGRMLFGADGYLYFGNGDDGDEGDYGNHQTVTNAMFAGLFRIDVNADEASPNSHPPLAHTPNAFHQSGPYTRQNYRIPNDNPFANVAGNVEEIYALGFRNPYSWSFDTVTGKLWLGDVGDSFREEIDLVTKGANYEWPIMEGDLTNLQPDVTSYVPGTTPTPPVFAYSHAEMADLSSIFGGFIYHGAALPELDGKLLYTDWITDHIWSLDITQTPPVRTLLVQNQYKYQPVGWGQDNAGEVYFMQYGPDSADGDSIHGGHVKKIVRDTVVANAPTRLTGTFLFKDVPSLTPADNLVPYTVSSPLWSDGAVKQRWVMVPSGQKISLVSGTGTTLDGTFKFPVGTMFIKQFDMAPDLTVAGRSRHLETRVMVVGNDTTYGYTFRWREDGSDADLVPDERDELFTDTTTGASRNWHYPSPAQCWSCHRNGYEDLANTQRNDKYRILGFTPAQLGTQVTALAAAGVFDSTVTPVTPLPQPGNTTETLGARAYAYLAANCSPCHHANAAYTGSGETWLATYGAGDLAARHLDQTANNYPMTVRLANVLGRPGLVNGTLVVPGQPDDSVLLGRVEANDPDVRMPPLARNVVDADGGAAILRAWIAAGAPAP